MSTSNVFTNSILRPVDRRTALLEARQPSGDYSVWHVSGSTVTRGPSGAFSGAQHYLVAAESSVQCELDPVICQIRAEDHVDHEVRIQVIVTGCESGREKDLILAFHSHGPFEKQIDRKIRTFVVKGVAEIYRDQKCPVRAFLADSHKLARAVETEAMDSLGLGVRIAFMTPTRIMELIGTLEHEAFDIPCEVVPAGASRPLVFKLFFNVRLPDSGENNLTTFRWLSSRRTVEEIRQDITTHVKNCYEAFLSVFAEEILHSRAPEVSFGLAGYFDRITNLELRFGLVSKTAVVTPPGGTALLHWDSVEHLTALLAGLRKRELSLIQEGDRESRQEAVQLRTDIETLESKIAQARKTGGKNAHGILPPDMVELFRRAVTELEKSPLRLGPGKTYQSPLLGPPAAEN